MISKRSSLLVVVLVVSFLLICGTSLAASARSKTGLGIKYSGGLQTLGSPYLAGSFRSDQFGLGVGVGYSNFGLASMIPYYLNGKYYIPVGGNLDLYTGAGIVGLNISTPLGSVNFMGFEGLGGMELSLQGMDLPVTLRGGLNYSAFNQPSTSTDNEFSFGGFGYHLGVEINF